MSDVRYYEALAEIVRCRVTGNGPERMCLCLARQFDSLIGAPGLEHALPDQIWLPTQVDRWAAHKSCSNSSRLTAQFVLNVWSPSTKWKVGLFNLGLAVKTLNASELAVIRAWMLDPRSI